MLVLTFGDLPASITPPQHSFAAGEEPFRHCSFQPVLIVSSMTLGAPLLGSHASIFSSCLCSNVPGCSFPRQFTEMSKAWFRPQLSNNAPARAFELIWISGSNNFSVACECANQIPLLVPHIILRSRLQWPVLDRLQVLPLRFRIAV